MNKIGTHKYNYLFSRVHSNIDFQFTAGGYFSKEYKIISKGHRNSQGLTFLDRDNLIFTDHRSKSGDKVNMLNLEVKNIKIWTGL